MLAKHSAIYFVGRIVPGIATLSTLAILTRLMTQQEYGDYALVISGVGLLNAVFFQWLGLALSRYYAIYSEQLEEIMTTALVGHLILVFGTGSFVFIIIIFVPNEKIRWLLCMVTVVGWAQAWFDINLRLAGARLNPIAYSLATSVKSIVGVSAGIYLFYAGFGLKGFFLGLTAALLATSLFFISYWRKVRIRNFSAATMKKFIIYGAPMALMFLLIIIIDVSDRFFLSWLLGGAAVGMYAPAYDLAQQSLGMLIGVVSLASFPLVVHALEKHGLESARRQIEANGRLLLQIAIPATAGLMLLAEDIVNLIIGSEFKAAAIEIIPVIALATFISGLRSGYFDFAFQLGLQLKGQIVVVACSALANIILNYILIHWLGVIGAAYATLIALSIGLALSAYLGRKVFPIPPLHHEKYRIIFASALMALGIFIFRDYHGIFALAAKIFGGVGIYIIASVILNINGARVSIFRLIKKS